MKKIIAILLVLLVGFSAFAIVGSGDADLVLKSTVGGQLFHGFTANTYTSGSTLKNALKSGGAEDGDNEYTIDFTVDTAQDVGYYNFYTTGNYEATVDFTIEPLTYTDSELTTYYVPYTFGYAAANAGASGAGEVTFAAGNTSFASSEVSTTAIVDVDIEDILVATGEGLRWFS